jgi:hypothetical protein
MGHVKFVVDRERIDFTGPFDGNDLLRMIQNFTFERGFDYVQDKDFEHNTKEGKQIEWQAAPYKKITDYVRYIIKIIIIGEDIKKIDIQKDGKKTKIEHGKLIVYLDGIIQYDYDDKWDERPLFQFIRTLYDKFIFKAYSERFEQRLAHDVNHLHDNLEKFFNMNKNYAVVSSGEN